jgi:hypothetical protein
MDAVEVEVIRSAKILEIAAGNRGQYMTIFTLDRRALDISAAAALLASCGGVNSSVPTAAGAAAPFTHHTTFWYTGHAQFATVPNDVKQIEVDAVGGKGAGSNTNGGFPTGPGGYGGRIVATLNVTPQEELTVYVGGSGSGKTGGFNGGAAGGRGEVSGEDIGGGGGGGASDVRAVGTALADRIVVAAGGGGGGGGGNGHYGGHGSPSGGKGGGLDGGRAKCRYGVCGGGGAGGTQSAGGTGGEAGYGGSCSQNPECGGDGVYGAGGTGGVGASYGTSSPAQAA